MFLAYDLITAHMNSKSFVREISIRITLHSRKVNDFQRRYYLKFSIHDFTIVLSPVLKVEGILITPHEIYILFLCPVNWWTGAIIW